MIWLKNLAENVIFSSFFFHRDDYTTEIENFTAEKSVEIYNEKVEMRFCQANLR